MPPLACVDSELPVVNTAPASAVAFHTTVLTSLTSSYLPYSNFCADAGRARAKSARCARTDTARNVRIERNLSRSSRLRNRAEPIPETVPRFDQVADLGLHERATNAANE